MGAYGVVCVAGSVTGPAGQGTISANAFSKMALGVKVDSYAFSYAGTAVSTLTGAIPKGIDRMYIGTGETGSNQMINGTIKRIAFYPKRLTNTELQNITS